MSSFLRRKNPCWQQCVLCRHTRGLFNVTISTTKIYKGQNIGQCKQHAEQNNGKPGQYGQHLRWDSKHALPKSITSALYLGYEHKLGKANLVITYWAILTLGVELWCTSKSPEYSGTQWTANEVEGGYELVQRSCNESCAIPLRWDIPVEFVESRTWYTCSQNITI